MKEYRLGKGTTKRHPVVAAIASIVFPGAGQLYNRELIRALISVILAIVLISTFIKMQIKYIEDKKNVEKIDIVQNIAKAYLEETASNRFIPLVLYLGLVVWSAYDAYVFAAYIQKTINIKTDHDDKKDITTKIKKE